MPPPSRRALSDAERADWAAFARHIRLLPGRAPLPVPAEPPPAPAGMPASVVALPCAGRRAPRSLAVGEQPGGLDRASWNRLAHGKLVPQRTLDLHGRTVQAAFHTLEAFLTAAHADRLRCVEIVTGRGSGEGGGAIRRELPMWLNLPRLRPLILAASHPHPANTGAVRLLLRRPR